jgi:hypothetical protein
MKNIKLRIDEKVEFQHEITVEVEDGVDIEVLLDSMEHTDNFADFAYFLGKEKCCKIVEISRDEDGNDSEIEVLDWNEVVA